MPVGIHDPDLLRGIEVTAGEGEAHADRLALPWDSGGVLESHRDRARRAAGPRPVRPEHGDGAGEARQADTGHDREPTSLGATRHGTGGRDHPGSLPGDT